ncbi:hypothetical protein N7490_003283 [Penicillium lividum]|nr:hypothetical protein N7490_003283 [Penicillium lividum]
MPDSHTQNHDASSVQGGTGATPTPANNVGGGADWGDQDPNEPRQGFGHVAPHNPRETMGETLGLKEQKGHAKDNFLQRADEARGTEKPFSAHGEPTCAGEDHSFMAHKPGCSDTLPGWDTVKNVFGAMGGSSS